MDKTIMVVDDDDLVRKTLVRVLTKAGYHILSVGSGQEALDLLKKNPVQVFFLDLRMPQMDGVELCRCIKKVAPKSCVFALTAYLTEFSIEQCREAGFDDYFSKPFDVDLMMITARNAFERIARWQEIEKKVDKIETSSR